MLSFKRLLDTNPLKKNSLKTDHVAFGKEDQGIGARFVAGNASAEYVVVPTDPMVIGPMDH